MFGAKYSRLRFWIISIILFIIAIPILIAKDIFISPENANIIFIIAVSGILVSAIWINTLANRIRDYGDNPWLALFSIIPFANIGLALFYGISKSNIKEVTQKNDSNSLSSAVYNHSKDIINGIKPAINEYKETHTLPNNDSQNNNISIDESKIYEDIMIEIEQDNKVKSTWAKALSQGDGNRDKSESLYISMRFEELKYQQSYQKEELNLSKQIENIEIEKEVEIKRDSSSKRIVFLIILISVLVTICIPIFTIIYFDLNKDASTTISSSMQSDNTSIQNNTNVQKNDIVANNENSPIQGDLDSNIKSTKIEENKFKCEEQNNLNACLDLEQLYFIILKDKNLGIKYAKIGCELGDSMSCNNLAVAYEENGLYNNNKLAITYYKKACEMKNEGACFTLGEIYSEQNSSKSINYYDKSCKLNNSVACVKIGYIFSKGLYSSKVDKKKAFNYYKKGADLGNSDAQLNLGIFYYIGENEIERNFEKSIMYLEQSAKQGNVKAYYILGIEYFTYNEKYKSAFWIKKAMDSGYNDAKTMWFNEKLWNYQ